MGAEPVVELVVNLRTESCSAGQLSSLVVALATEGRPLVDCLEGPAVQALPLGLPLAPQRTSCSQAAESLAAWVQWSLSVEEKGQACHPQ